MNNGYVKKVRIKEKYTKLKIIITFRAGGTPSKFLLKSFFTWTYCIF